MITFSGKEKADKEKLPKDTKKKTGKPRKKQ